MGRQERPIDPDRDPVQGFAFALRCLRESAGQPGYRELARRAHYSVTALAEAAGGSALPSLPVALAYVEACGGDPRVWAAHWRAASTAVSAVSAGSADSVDSAGSLGSAKPGISTGSAGRTGQMGPMGSVGRAASAVASEEATGAAAGRGGSGHRPRPSPQPGTALMSATAFAFALMVIDHVLHRRPRCVRCGGTAG